ncbi:anaerobic ribonucleoside-triphosphate reductase activating protein [Methanocaldococcus indicus]|uniref:anaerobic ribonucleoside-triphosphate reductase activating protein n=1 Tax=Methanocaldococcus indicus TaxID=213231 RepID=UPI003C6D02A6
MVYVTSIIDSSTIDYYKKFSAVIFLSGCNMRCKYCHNLKDVLNRKYKMSVEELFKKIDFFLADALVISGGEPTLQKEDVVEIAKKAKELNLSVKIDTNGTHPEVIEELIKLNLIDYVALDIKCRFDKYKELTGYDKNIKDNILKIIKMCKDNNIFIECRTTYVPKVLDKKDIEEIAKIAKDADLYTIQQFNPENAYDEKFRNLPIPKTSELVELGKIAKKYVNRVLIKGDEIIEL